jgi:hypothetical protein
MMSWMVRLRGLDAECSPDFELWVARRDQNADAPRMGSLCTGRSSGTERGR